MNIIVKTYAGNIIVRPDTTWEKDNEDFYPQDFIRTLTYTPVLFARISKPGKSVGLRFVSRYYDSANYGVLLYPENLIGNGSEDFACASCIDHTSFLPAPLYQKCVFGNNENEFVLSKNGEEIFRANAEGLERLEDTIAEATTRIYIRTGDLVCMELAPRKALWESAEGLATISGTFCENNTVEFNIK